MRRSGTGRSIAFDKANQPLDVETASNIAVPREFAVEVMPLLKPGVVLLATDASVGAETTGGKARILDSDPPSA